VLPVLQRALTQPSTARLYFEAAGALADPELLPALRALKEQGVGDVDLDRAIEACEG
jgi:hypothetical protein